MPAFKLQYLIGDQWQDETQRAARRTDNSGSRRWTDRREAQGACSAALLHTADCRVIEVGCLWKIQTASANGWADIKSCSDDCDTYTLATFATQADAEAEIIELAFNGDVGSWRAVPVDEPAQDDLYE